MSTAGAFVSAAPLHEFSLSCCSAGSKEACIVHLSLFFSSCLVEYESLHETGPAQHLCQASKLSARQGTQPVQATDAAAPTVAQQIAALPPKRVGEIGDLVMQPEPKRKVTSTVLHEAPVPG